jgi:hypothetical protein
MIWFLDAAPISLYRSLHLRTFVNVQDLIVAEFQRLAGCLWFWCRLLWLHVLGGI